MYGYLWTAFGFFDISNNFLITAGISLNISWYLFRFSKGMGLDDAQGNNEKYPSLKVAFVNHQVESSVKQDTVNKAKDEVMETFYSLSDHLDDPEENTEETMKVAYNKEKDEAIRKRFYALSDNWD